MKFIKEMKKRNLVALISVSIVLIVSIAIFALRTDSDPVVGEEGRVDTEQDVELIVDDASENDVDSGVVSEDNNDSDSSSEIVKDSDSDTTGAANLSPDFVIRIGDQELTGRELEIVASLHEGDGDVELLLGMHVYTEITNMLLFQYAEGLGIAPSIAEANAFIESDLRQLVPAEDFTLMGISEEEYWEGIGLRMAQNGLVADNMTQYLNDNDPSTSSPIEQYENFVALGEELFQAWMHENPELVAQFRLAEVAEILVDSE